MKVVLFLASLLVGIVAVPMFMFTVTQVAGAALFAGACVLFGAAAVVDAIEQATRKILDASTSRRALGVPVLHEQ